MPASYRMIETVLKKPREFDCVILQPKTSCSLPWVDP